MKLVEKLKIVTQKQLEADNLGDEDRQIWTGELKRVVAIQEVLSIVNKHGIGEEFYKVFDIQETSLQLCPTVAVQWPPHIKWARQKALISQAPDPHVWRMACSSASLAKHGIQQVSIEGEQDKLVGEKISKHVKQDSFSVVKKDAFCFYLTLRAFRWAADDGSSGSKVQPYLHA